MKPSNYLKELYRNPTDEKYTPGYGVLPIIKYIPESKIIWCPFDTEHSEFVLKFKAAGFEVVYSHICKGQDFFEYEPPQWDVLVSNPPFQPESGRFRPLPEIRKTVRFADVELLVEQRCTMPAFPEYRAGIAYVRQAHSVRGREKRAVQ